MKPGYPKWSCTSTGYGLGLGTPTVLVHPNFLFIYKLCFLYLFFWMSQKYIKYLEVWKHKH